MRNSPRRLSPQIPRHHLVEAEVSTSLLLKQTLTDSKQQSKLFNYESITDSLMLSFADKDSRAGARKTLSRVLRNPDHFIQ